MLQDYFRTKDKIDFLAHVIHLEIQQFEPEFDPESKAFDSAIEDILKALADRATQIVTRSAAQPPSPRNDW